MAVRQHFQKLEQERRENVNVAYFVTYFQMKRCEKLGGGMRRERFKLSTSEHDGIELASRLANCAENEDVTLSRYANNVLVSSIKFN